jgi:hypothetical protein
MQSRSDTRRPASNLAGEEHIELLGTKGKKWSAESVCSETAILLKEVRMGAQKKRKFSLHHIWLNAREAMGMKSQTSGNATERKGS